jgi:hypothetical protein
MHLLSRFYIIYSKFAPSEVKQFIFSEQVLRALTEIHVPDKVRSYR